MLAVLPLLALTLLALIYHRKDADWREAALTAAVVWGVWLTAITEVLSRFHWIYFGTLLSVWGCACGALGLVYYRKLQRQQQETNQAETPHPPFKLRPLPALVLVSLGIFVGLIGLVAVLAPPHTWDSMTYHMSRVVHWMQNHSVAHYTTYNLPQLFHPPLAEFIILHLQSLSGGDRFANLVQWFSLVGSAIGTSLIARQLGATWAGQVFTAVLTATIPMGILQASSTQNDYVVAFWTVCLAYFVLRAVQTHLTLMRALIIGACLGLAILSKSSGYLHAFPFLVWLTIAKWPQLRWKLWRPLLTIGGLALLLNLNHYLRNLELFGTPLGTPANFAREYKIEVYSPSALISNVLRNLSLHVDIVRYFQLQTWISPITGLVEKALTLIHKVLGIGMNDPRTTFPVGSYQVPGLSFDENTAGNPLHLLLILGAIGLVLVLKRFRSQRLLVSYTLAIVAAFLLLCLMLKIQPYQSRHHLAYFVLFSAVLGVIVSQWRQRVVYILAILILVSASPWVMQNKFRPMVGANNIFNTDRMEQFFVDRTHLAQPYREAANQIKATTCTQVGLSLGTGVTVGNDYWEYPFWALLNQGNITPYRLEHLNPQNISNRKADQAYQQFEPCAVIAVRVKKEPDAGDRFTFGHRTFVRQWQQEPVSIYSSQAGM